MMEIIPRKLTDNTVRVPGSKSYTHRVCMAAALSDGPCRVLGSLDSDDTGLTLSALESMGIAISREPEALLIIGKNGTFAPCDHPINLGNSGTSMRLLSGLAALGSGDYILTGSERMQERPINDLLAALQDLGISAMSINNTGCPPVRISGGTITGTRTRINCSTSSQYLSALLLMAPCTTGGMDIEVTGGPVSKPYIDMTLDIMDRFGITFARNGYIGFHVPGAQTYRSGEYIVEPDASQAGYFWAAAAVTGTRVKVLGITKASRQGDARFAEVLAAMGCKVEYHEDGIAVIGGPLSAVTVDMADMPDLVPTLAVIAAFAQGITVIENVAHLRAKESDRLEAVKNELCKMGIEARTTDSGISITGGPMHGARIKTYDDHRIAMCFSVAGLKVPGVMIEDEICVAKSFPEFFNVLNTLA
jgi:3-phosphoshikimate 1-carboxyvinyltransferase